MSLSLSIGSNESVQLNTDTAQGIKTAKLAQNQQELEAQMALNLIESSAGAINTGNLQAPTETVGQNINIKV